MNFREKLPAAFSKSQKITKNIIIGILIALLIRSILIQAFYIPSSSMENTLLIGDALFVNKFIYGTKIPFTNNKILKIKNISRNDIIVFESPEDTRIDFIKRVIGMPGDTIEIKNKHLLVNGIEIHENHAINKDTNVLSKTDNTKTRDFYGPVKVPPGSYFMMGDNRDYSYDSRFWGFLNEKHVKGKAMFIYWSREKGKFYPRIERLGKVIF